MTIKIACLTVDCADALTVGRFWSAALGRPLDAGADSGFASIGFAARRDRNGWGPVDPADEPTWVFARVPEPKAGKNRLHLDVVAADVEAEIAGLVELGATRVTDHEQYGYTWTLMADPEGNEFDIARQLLGGCGLAPQGAQPEADRRRPRRRCPCRRTIGGGSTCDSGTAP